MCWCFLGPMLGCRTITLLFNIEFHPAKNQKRCKVIDDTRLLAVVVGESRHEDHHVRPRRARRLDLDLPWWLTLSWMQASGLIWACKYLRMRRFLYTERTLPVRPRARRHIS